jgi:D-mannonate dehydratase
MLVASIRRRNVARESPDVSISTTIWRHAAGRSDHQVPMRADRGHLLVDGVGKFGNAANSSIGFKGLVELRGVMRALDYAERRYS